jgi:hypothetical protein
MSSARKLVLGAAATAILAGGAAAIAAARSHDGVSPSAVRPGILASATNGRAWNGSPRSHGPSDELAAAASYLDLTAAELQTKLQSGKTLAQVADATNGKSAAGLIDALVAAEKKELAAAVSAGRLTQAQADTIEASLVQRFTALVNGTAPQDGPFGPRMHDAYGFHGSPGGTPPPASPTA